MYAFIMAFEMLQGERPFRGPDFREQHSTRAPPALTNCPPSLASLVTECLYKAPAARPTPANILARLPASQQAPSPAAAIQTASQKIVDKQAQEEARASAEKSTAERRQDLFTGARQSFERIQEMLIARVLEAAPPATVARTPNVVIRLGEGALVVDPVRPVPANVFRTFDVIAYSAIAARKPRDRYDYEGRSHSLWFCDAHEEGVYRWFETAFMVQPLIPQRSTTAPFALAPTDGEAAGAFSPAVSVRQVAWAPIPFDQGEEEQFIERWLEGFAAAVDGTLRHPPSMPENSGGWFRRQGSTLFG
ncbi:MAG TPA: hypothetical protein VGW38_19390 [Chloroflexota bacterium]|nr:hypothetical protein [Chloroflexota bacterium]